MKIYSMMERKNVISELGNRLNVKPEYQGAPTFAYKIGEYTVMKDGNMEVDDLAADVDMLRQMHVAGFIDDSWDADREVIEISFPLEGHTGKTLTNLIRIMFCRSTLINKVIGCTQAFKVDERFAENLDNNPPVTIEDFLQLLEQCGGNEMNGGLEFTQERISFFGFPLTQNSDVIKAYTQLAELINKMAMTQKRVLMEKPDISNEKYSFRVWLLRLGMKGEEFKLTRQILLKNLSGHSAFRTSEQIEVAKEKIKVKRALEKEEAPCLESQRK